MQISTHQRLAIAIFLLSFCSLIHAGPVDDLLTEAHAGNSDAQFKLALAYDFGRGVPRDLETAKTWYSKSAEQGNAEAQNSLGSVYQAEKNYKNAKLWFEKAATQNNALALNNLAYLYDLGLGMQQDRKMAFDLYRQSADLGWGEAMWNLANMYGAGQLGAPDLYQACVWTVRAERFSANNGNLMMHVRRTKPQILKMLGGRASSCEQEGSAWSPQNG